MTFNQSTKVLIIGFVPFFLFKNFNYSTQQEIYGFGTDRMHHGRMAMDGYTLVHDPVKLSWFKIIE